VVSEASIQEIADVRRQLADAPVLDEDFASGISTVRLRRRGTSAQRFGYRGPEVCRIVGITYRQLDYWARTGLIRPSVADAPGSGYTRLFSYGDLISLKLIKAFLDAGASLKQVRSAIEYINRAVGDGSATEAFLVLTDSSPVIAHNSAELNDVIHDGQGVYNVASLAGIRDEVDDAIRRLATDPKPLGDGEESD
jgi:DNA-binding transcriptional MerR regulator